MQIATKLNRSHIVPGEITYLLPCLGRIEIDVQASGPQAVSMEDSTACIHGSRGQREPVADDLLSEPEIVAGLAKATLKPNPKLDWDAWVADYSLVRDAIERTYPEQFKDFNRRMFEPGGFPRPLPARERKWKTPNGKANFTVPKSALNPPSEADGIYELMTMRADGQFNTTVYNEDDRFRGVYGSRDVVLMNAADMAEIGVEQGDLVTLSTEAKTASSAGLRIFRWSLRYPAEKPRGILSGMQRTDPALAFCRRQQSASREIYSCSRCASGTQSRRRVRSLNNGFVDVWEKGQCRNSSVNMKRAIPDRPTGLARTKASRVSEARSSRATRNAPPRCAARQRQ